MYRSKAEIAQARRLFGPAPILTTEVADHFEEFFLQLAITLKPQDFIELLLIWHFGCESWSLNRLTRHATIAIERRHQEGVRLKLQRARLEHAQAKGKIKAEIRSWNPHDIAALAEFDQTIDSTLDDMDEIYERKASERDHNAAFEKTVAFQEQLDRLRNSAARRRDDALGQLELYRVGLGAQAKETAEQILDGECQEVIAISTAAAALVPANVEATNDAENTTHNSND